VEKAAPEAPPEPPREHRAPASLPSTGRKSGSGTLLFAESAVSAPPRAPVRIHSLEGLFPAEPVSPRAPAAPVKRPAGKAERKTVPSEPSPAQTVLGGESELPKPRLIGEALGFCILAELNGQILLIDKHAAHERLLFDRMRRADTALSPQELIAPLVFSPGAGDTALLLENSALLRDLGFVLEALGEDSLAVRAIPMEIDGAQALPLLEELLEKLRQGLRPDGLDIREELMQSLACRAAVKAGRSSDPLELQALIDEVCARQIRYCPHGRPVFWTLTRAELDRRFLRTP